MTVLHNRLEWARQEYRNAKEHFKEVCRHRIAGDADHNRRYRDAAERRSAAFELYLQAMDRHQSVG